MSKSILFGNKVSDKVLEGIAKTAKIVGETLGPLGNNVILDRPYGSPRITKDGITVLKEVSFEDVFENAGAKLLREASDQTNSQTGDGTTTTCILTEAIYREGLRFCTIGYNKIQIRNGITKMARLLSEKVKEHAVKISTKEEIYKVANIASNHSPDIAEILSDVFSKIGSNGTIKVEEGKGFNLESKIVDGMQFDQGYISPYFSTNERLESEMNDVLILIIDKRINSIQEILSPMQEVNRAGRPVLIIAEALEGDALSSLVLNRLRGMQVCAVQCPSYGSTRKGMLQDIAILTGGKVISEETGMSPNDANLENGIFGSAKRVIVTKDSCTIIGGNGSKEELDKRITQLKTLISTSTDEYEQKKLRERLAKLDGGVGVISVGASTMSEAKERMDLVEDAFCACKAALAGGVVPGGGTTLLRLKYYYEKFVDSEEAATMFVGDEKFGAKIVLNSLSAPIKQILGNAHDSMTIIDKFWDDEINLTDTTVYDVLTKTYGDMFQLGIIDPANVIVSEIQNASSIAGLLLTTSAAITELPQEKTQDGLNGRALPTV